MSEEALHVVGRGSLVLVSVAFQKVEPADAGTYGIEHLVVRLVYSLLAGAVPCKIDRSYFREGVDIPNVFPSARSFQTKVQEEGYHSMYSSAREFYVPKGRLAEHLEKALPLV